MWKFLKSKSIWVALSGMMLAAGTLFTAVDEAKAGTASNLVAHETIYGTKCTGNKSFGAKVVRGGYYNDAIKALRVSFALAQGSSPIPCEVWIMIKPDANNPSTWYYWGVPYNDYYNGIYGAYVGGFDSSTPYQAYSGTMPVWVEIGLEQRSTTASPTAWDLFYNADQICVILDYTINGTVNLDCVNVIQLN